MKSKFWRLFPPLWLLLSLSRPFPFAVVKTEQIEAMISAKVAILGQIPIFCLDHRNCLRFCLVNGVVDVVAIDGGNVVVSVDKAVGFFSQS